MSDKYPGGFVTAGAPAGFSVAFNGSSYLSTTANAGLNFGTGDFTLEAWVYPTTTLGDATCILTSVSSGGLMFGTNGGAGSGVWALGRRGIAWDNSSSAIPVLNQWSHIAVCRSGTSVRIFVNGVQSGSTFTNSTSYDLSSGGTIIGYQVSYMNGYFSNVRATNSALYTATFTPPTQLFPVSGTQLLTCQSPTIIDNSSNALVFANTGSPTVSNFTPFAGYTGFNPALGAAAGGVWTLDEAAYYQNNRQWPIYDPYFNQTTLMLHGNGTNGAQNNTFLDSSTNNFTITRNGNTTQGTFTPFSQTGWSTYFLRSNTDYLGLPNGSVATGSNDFSIEAFIYPLDRASNYAVFGGNTDRATAGGSSITISLTSSNGYIEFTGWFGGSAVNLYSPTIPINTWTHFVVCRTGTTIGMFVNGVRVSTVACSGSINAGSSANNPSIGSNGTGSADNYTGYISNFRMIIGSGVYSALNTSYTLPTAPLTVTTNTRVLACQSNRYVDNSANNYTITPSGSPSVQAFSPFVPAYITPTTYSNYFNGSSSYLSVASSALDVPSSTNFTIEGWVYLNAHTNNQPCIFNNYTSGGGLALFAGHNSFDGNLFNLLIAGSIYSGGTIVYGQWTHFAVVRNGTGSGNVSLYINGISVLSTISTNAAITYTGQVSIGTAGDATSAAAINGCISNFRWNTTTAVYTAAFTPPTAPLTAISGTQLLTCQNSTFIDNSTNNLTLTAAGTVRPVTSPTPFPALVDQTTLNSAYSTSLIGGSYYGSATGDYLSFTDSSNLLDMGTTAASFECWYYMTATGAYQNIFLKYGGTAGWNATNGIEYGFAINNGVPTLSYFTGGTSLATISDPTTRTVNQWYHLAIATDASNNISMYVNGVRVANATSAISKPTTRTTVNIGSTASQYVVGYLAGMRFLTGSNAYNAASLNIGVPPLTPPTAVSGTQLLCNFTNGGIFDNTAKNVLQTIGTAQISTTQSKYGGSSIKTDGSTSSWVLVPFRPTLDLSTGAPDWTLECWGYVVSFANSPYFFNKGGVAATYYTNYSFSMNSSGVVYCTLGNNSGETSYSFGTCATNTWYHFAATRQGSTIRTFLNGVLVTSQSIATTMTDSGADLYVGCLKNLTSNVLNGYVDDLRITKGYARYTTNFTPPTSQLQDQ